MPLNNLYLPKVDGLQTETSNINSDPRSLADSLDVISNREDFLESRHGHPVCRLDISDNTGFAVSTALDLFTFKNETERAYIVTYNNPAGYSFLWVSQTQEEIQLTSSVSKSTISPYPITRSASVNKNPIVFSHDQRLFFMTDNGVFYTKNTYESSPVVYKNTFPVIRTASINPEWRATSNYTSAMDAENSHWLVPGYQVNIKLVIEVETKFNNDGSRRIESPPSRIYEVLQLNPANTDTRTRTSNMLVTISNLTISSLPQGLVGDLPSGGQYRMFLKIYRTLQFKAGEKARTEYFLAHPEIQINSATIVDPSNASTYIRLTANDDFVENLEHLYNDTTQGGIGVTNHLPVPSKNVTPFRSYHIYSNLSLPALTTIGLTALPDEGDRLFIRLERSDGNSPVPCFLYFTSSYVSPGDVIIPSNAQTVSSPYLPTERDLTFRGIRPGFEDVSGSLNARIRIVPGSNQGQVEPYGKITQVQYILGASGSQNTTTVRVYPDTSGFDVNRFQSPGIAAIVDTSGRIRSLFSYDNIQKNTATTNYIDFVYAVTEAAAVGSNLTQTLYVYYIPGEQIKTLPLYIGDSARYLSLLPCKNEFQESVAIPQITATLAYDYRTTSLFTSLAGVTYSTTTTTVTLNFPSAHGLFNGESYLVAASPAIPAIDGTYTITVTSSTQITYSKSGSVSGPSTIVGGSITPTVNDLVTNPFYLGPLNRPFSLLLNDLARNICDELNRAANDGAEYLLCRGGDLDQPGVIILESLNPDYEIISLSKRSTTNRTSLASYSITSNEVTINTSSTHPYSTGDTVSIYSPDALSINGDFTITKLSNTSFKYSKTLPNTGSTITITGFADRAKQCYEPPVPTNPSGISTAYTVFAKSEKAGNAFVVSKLNLPEVVPTSDTSIQRNVSGPYYPARIGAPNKAIVACATTKDSIYMLKEDGIARVTLGVNTSIPTIDTINLFNTTVFCQSAGSVQVLNDSVIFLAQDGVYSIEGIDINKLSRSIETELKLVLSQCKNNNLLESIRSFANAAKNLYGIYIPVSSTGYVTYVLNTITMRWVKWSNQFNGAVVDLEGRLTTITTPLERTTTANCIRQDRYTNDNPRNEADQIDDDYTLTGVTSSDSGLQRTIVKIPGGGDTSVRLGNLFYRFRYYDYAKGQYTTKQVYYYDGTTFYKLTNVERIDEFTLRLTFPTPPPAFSTSHRLIVGVNFMIEFQPFSAGNPSSLKQFSGYHIHTEESVVDLGVQFKTEASAYSTIRMVSSTPANRTVYRCFIPTTAARGRFLYRKITHTRPFEICAIPAQAIIFRDTGSERVQKAQ